MNHERKNDQHALAAQLNALIDQISTIIVGKRSQVEDCVACMLAGGHLLIEDVPGVGKTTLAHALAVSLGLRFSRTQFTADLMPGDLSGVAIYDRGQQAFVFHPGPIFAQVLLADEINRATPKTQSALLEAMSERKVSVERKRFSLPEPFTVLATQNPLEYQGTFPLPESQLDRFLMALSLGYPPRADERDLLLSGGVEDVLDHLRPVLARDGLVELQARVGRVRIADKLADYMLSLAETTRHGGDFLLGVSTRGLQALFRATQALALCEGRGYAIPDDVQRLAPAVLAHRVVLKRGASELDQARRAIERVVAATPVPL